MKRSSVQRERTKPLGRKPLWEKLTEVLDVMTDGRVAAKFREASHGSDRNDPTEGGKFRRLSAAKRDLPPVSFERAREMAYYLHQRNPVAHRMIELPVIFTLGDEFMVKLKVMKRIAGAPDEETGREDAQQVWDDFYNDPINNLESELMVLIQDLFLSGELILPAAVNDVDGHVRIGYIDPSNIKEVKTHGKNARIVTELLAAPDDATGEMSTLKVIRPQLDDAGAEDFEKLAGDVFYFRINRVAGQKRGNSELLDVLDWIDLHDQFLFDGLHGFALRNAFFYDVTVEGATQEDIDAMNIAEPPPGGVKAHNEKITWDVKAPDLKAADIATGARLYQNFIIGGKGYPEHWFADGGNTNLATAEEMGTPVMKTLKAKQRIIRTVVRFMAQYVIDQAVLHGALPLGENEYVKIEVNAFDFERKDAAVLGNAFVQIVTALSLAVAKNWVDNETAKKVVDGMLQRLGIEPDPSKTFEQIAGAQGKAEVLEAHRVAPSVKQFVTGGGRDLSPSPPREQGGARL